MCGRFSLTATRDEVQEFFGLLDLEDFPPRYNIAPTQPVLIVKRNEHGQSEGNLPDREAILVRWGLVPSWVKDPKDFPLLINARAETVATKNSFRAAMRHRRALMPASGFYEWRRTGKDKPQPFWVRPKNGGVIAFAALMETWISADGSEIDTGAILTTDANATLAPIHHRMPVVIPPEEFTRWLDCINQEPREVADLLKPPPDDLFEAIPVSTKVNKVANTGPEVQQPVEPKAGEVKSPDNKSSKKKSGDDPGQMSLI